MVLNLNVPALVEKPLIIAETRPHKITKLLNSLPVTNTSETALALQEELEILNRQKIAPDARSKALETYRPAIIELVDSLTTHFCNATLPLADQEKYDATLACALWTELAYGYKLVLLDQEAKLFKFGHSKLLTLSIQRTIDAIRRLHILHYQIYHSPPAGLWSELHQLYAFAAQRTLQDLDLESSDLLPLQAHNSISNAYKQTLLMHLVNPQHLSSKEIKQTSDYISRFADLAKIQAPGKIESSVGIFLITLNQDKPPAAHGKNSSKSDQENDLLLVTMDLARQVHNHIKLLQAGQSLLHTGLPDNANHPRYQDLLAYLLRHWGASPKRIFNRTKKNDGIELVSGLSALHSMLNGKTYSAAQSDATTDRSQVPQNTASTKPARWQVLNISAGGMALRKLPITDGNIRIGDLVGIKITPTSHWSVGTLRWASNHDHSQLDIGIQLIAPEAKPALARIVNQGELSPVLILPEIPSLKQATSLVAVPGTYSPARLLELEENGHISRIMITRLIERTNSFDRFHFSLL
ncbi:hypothetical protein LG201_13310 [Methylobacillus gramineus]|uniref:hypothetical protein n=1 Tax=Methylobacillus gramineus TaxID=755169 RepID=UPI001CFFC9D5|nr:hypothetical protein [Methylobacillus gramineus]MCB5186187.1 hypothetical protein [Methylobacillus gramineus]